MTAQIVNLTTDVYFRFHKSLPPHRLMGVAIVRGPDVLAVGGIMFRGGWVSVFMDAKPEAGKYPILIFKAGMKVIRMARNCGLPAFAEQDTEQETSSRFLEHLGFQRTNHDNLWSL